MCSGEGGHSLNYIFSQPQPGAMGRMPVVLVARWTTIMEGFKPSLHIIWEGLLCVCLPNATAGGAGMYSSPAITRANYFQL